MNHIVTKSEIETKARVKYAEAKPSVMVADDALAKKVSDLLALRKKMDQDELLKSQMMGEIMEQMKKATVLKNKDGAVIVTWKEASSTSKVDYKGLCKLYKVKKEDYAAYTTTSTGARTFELIETKEEREKVSDLIEQMEI